MSWLAPELLKIGAIKFGAFVLSSGQESPYYIDIRRVYGYPWLIRRIAMEMAALCSLSEVDVVAGVETSGIPLAAYLSCLTGKPLAYVRKEAKRHGTKSLVEGEVEGKSVALVDDVITTGFSLVRAVEALRSAGARPVKALVVVDREQGGREALAARGVGLCSLATATEIFDELLSRGLIERDLHEALVRYIRSRGAGVAQAGQGGGGF